MPYIGPRKTASLFEEYFYGLLVAIFVGLAILLRAGGMGTHEALVIGLWVAAIVWFARQARGYYKFRSGTGAIRKTKPGVKGQSLAITGPLSPSMKPMIGPQWPLKPKQKTAPPANGGTPPAAPEKPKSAFVYERPTLPDRKPKLPANWPSKKGKKPKR